MAEKKKRQGQPGVKKVKEVCPKCEEYLKTIWTTENRKWKRVGLYCPNQSCDYIVKDYVELVDETEPMNEIEND